MVVMMGALLAGIGWETVSVTGRLNWFPSTDRTTVPVYDPGDRPVGLTLTEMEAGVVFEPCVLSQEPPEVPVAATANATGEPALVTEIVWAHGAVPLEKKPREDGWTESAGDMLLPIASVRLFGP